MPGTDSAGHGDDYPDRFGGLACTTTLVAVTSMRNVVYVNGRGNSQAVVVLAICAALGACAALIAYRLGARAGAATAPG